MSLSREERRAKELGETVVSALRDATAAVQSLRDDHGEQRHEEAIRALETVRTSVDALTAANQAQGEQSATFQNRSLLVQWCLFGATTAAFIAAAVYAGIAYKQKITMDRTFAEVKKQTNAAQDSTTAAQNAVTQSRDQFREDRRPYIWLTKTGLGAPSFIPNIRDPRTGQVTWDWHWTNYGKTPALDVKYTQYIKVGQRPYVKSYGASESFGPPLPPDKDDFSTVVSDPGITPTEFNDLMLITHIGTSVSIKVHVTYTDAYRASQYETNICLQRLNLGAVSYCREGNEIK